jgi:dolichol-phosphate mannosyltransferase
MKQLGYRVDSFEDMVRVIHEEDSWYPPVSSGGHVEMPTAVAVSGQDDRFDMASKKKATGPFGDGAVVGGQVPELSLIVPCFDEGYRLNTLLPELAEICSNSDLTVETIILDDYVDEESPSVAQILQPQYPELHIRVLRRKLSRRGYGAVIRYGLGYAVGKYALCVDVNGIDPVHLIPDMLDQARKGSYLVQCSRYLDPEHVQGISLKYRLYQRVYRTMVRATMGRIIPDSTYAFKLFDRSYVMGLGLTSNRFNFSPEITFKLLLDGATVTSIGGSHGRFGDIQPRFRLVSELWGFLYVFARASLHRVGILWF